MHEIWAIPVSGEEPTDGGESTLKYVHLLRTEWDEHQAELERIQNRCQMNKPTTEELNR